MDLSTVVLLDKVQKKKVISKESYLKLKKQELVEGNIVGCIASSFE
ncbi:MAG: hypothetical protein MR384_03880 [Lachnospiraceae bacterium]|nr:hypothetical protein [Lachnospiraceae bacterium]